MSREVRRVPLDFDWRMNEVWSGYLMPDELKLPTCESCGGAGETTARRWLRACSHMILMLDDDLRDQERGRPMHPYFNDFYSSGYGTRPSPDIAELGAGLAGRESSFLGHDSIDGWRAEQKIIAAAGLDPKVWGICASCNGSGAGPCSAELRQAHQAWSETDPPTGEGWQLWETASEGSPISPVFASSDALVDWLCATKGMDPSSARRFVEAGWAPSFVSSPTEGVVDGMTFIGGERS